LSAVATVAVMTLASLPIIGVDGLLASRAVLTNGGTNSQQFHNQSLVRAPLWIAAAFNGTSAPFETLLGYVLLVLAFAGFAGGMAAVAPRRFGGSNAQTRANERGVSELLGSSWALATMVLVMPIAWEHHDAWLLPAIVVCLGYALRGLARPDGPRARRRSALL